MARVSNLWRRGTGYLTAPSLSPRVPSFMSSRAGFHSFQEISAKDLKFGQPLHETHPHLLNAGEITPGIQAIEYAQRRAALAALMPPKSVAIVPATTVKYRSHPVFYPFSQDSNFAYLTGFLEPDALAVIDKRGPEPLFHLFVQEKDNEKEKWDGSRSGTQAALDVFNADESGDIYDVRYKLPMILDGADYIFTDAPGSHQPETAFGKYFGDVASLGIGTKGFGDLLGTMRSEANTTVRHLSPLMHQLRVVKSDAEIFNMRTAGKISGRAITDAMRRSWSFEKDLHAFLDYSFREGGCNREAYVPVIAGGENAQMIHYVRNDDVIAAGDLVLVDAGGEYGGYITDITRTWPNSGKFTDAQRDLYSVVLAVQKSCVSLCREDANLTLDKLNKIATNGLRDGLLSLGFDVSGDAMRILYPHHIGHYIGLDVHDCSNVSKNEKLREGMCVAIEPGLYVPHDERWPAAFRGLSVRIEDSVCVEDEHPLVLTTEAVKEIIDIEALRR